MDLTLKEKLFNDLKEAMRNKDASKKEVIQVIRAGVLQVEKDNKVELDDSGVIDIISKELKRRMDVLPEYQKSGRQDLIDEQLKQIEIVKSYLPEQLSEDEISEIVNAVIKETGAQSMKDMGKVMAAITPQVKGRADNRLVSELVKNQLNK